MMSLKIFDVWHDNRNMKNYSKEKGPLSFTYLASLNRRLTRASVQAYLYPLVVSTVLNNSRIKRHTQREALDLNSTDRFCNTM